MNGDCSPILVADDGGEVLAEIAVREDDRPTLNADGTLSIDRPEGERAKVLVPEDTEIGQRIHAEAAERGQTVEEFVIDAVENYLGDVL